MTGNRWWHVFFATTMAMLAVIDVFSWAPSAGQRIAAWATIALLSIVYVTIGRRALGGEARLRLPFALALIIGSGALVACSPNLAFVQAIAFPLLWVVIPSTRVAMVANVGLAVAVSAGFIVSVGTDSDNLAQTALIQSISLVGSLALGLWISRIADLSAERLHLLDELTATQAELAAANHDTGVVSERERLAREIHDTIAQSLTGIVMMSQRAQRELAHERLEPLADQLRLLEQSAREVLVETRSLVAASAPVDLGGGIAAALERLAERYRRESGIAITVIAEVSVDLDRDTEVVLLRCAQEALANVRKHSHATSATVRMVTELHTATLSVTDDGTGFDSTKAETGFGLPGMRDRLALVNGALALSSVPGGGTSLSVSLPIGVAA
ncbi:sensor histidine kinase [Glaciihabitans sp. INWT7]|uniref:sensor histidine kinase n=1 Tax=Glaciihabitans sp. INWT7 TaxID=2596912 RepID=UPI00162A94E6|nr:sensor histidine kinase [Glaciihabitans sp. INWT7]QNE45746.1 sensor histidine kinase [Glaciihabitans sp. INWT7]